MPKWKYQKEPKKSTYDTYLRFEPEIPKSVRIKFWKFEKSQINESLFNCTVTWEDDKEADKIWSVWDPSLRDDLKKQLKAMNPNKSMVELVVVKHVADEEETFTLKSLKKVV
jgi:hypothetical protein